MQYFQKQIVQYLENIYGGNFAVKDIVLQYSPLIKGFSGVQGYYDDEEIYLKKSAGNNIARITRHIMYTPKNTKINITERDIRNLSLLFHETCHSWATSPYTKTVQNNYTSMLENFLIEGFTDLFTLQDFPLFLQQWSARRRVLPFENIQNEILYSSGYVIWVLYLNAMIEMAIPDEKARKLFLVKVISGSSTFSDLCSVLGIKSNIEANNLTKRIQNDIEELHQKAFSLEKREDENTFWYGLFEESTVNKLIPEIVQKIYSYYSSINVKNSKSITKNLPNNKSIVI